MKSPEIVGEKGRIRSRMRAALARLDDEARKRASEEVARRLAAISEIETARSLLLFRSLPGEVETASIFAAALARGQAVFFPRVEGASLSFRRVTAETHWETGPSPALEPVSEDRLTTADLSRGPAVVLVPGLAFSEKGGRLGRGGGHYDRALSTPPLAGLALRIGVAFDCQLLDALPNLPHDVPVDIVVTDTVTLRR